MDSERHLGGRSKPRQHPAKGNCGHRSAALAHEDISSGFLFALETAQGAKFDAGQWMDGRHPILEPMNVQAAMDEIGLLPAQRAYKIMVASRCPCRLFPAAFMSRSTSRSVRYSRVRYSAFGSRPGGTVLFTVVGALARDLDFIGNFPALSA
jgi:hypothetical protein